MKKFLSIIFFIIAVVSIHADDSIINYPLSTINYQLDAKRHWGFALDGGYGLVIKHSKWVKTFLQDQGMWSVGGELRYSTLPSDSNAFDHDYNYPTLFLGARYGNYNKVTQRRESSSYTSNIGNVFSLYGGFSRSWLRAGRWDFDYTLTAGASYVTNPYDINNNADNELIGSAWNIYLGLGLHATCRISSDIGIRIGMEYMHNSNGALARPNMGTNAFMPALAVVYHPDYKEREKDIKETPRTNKYAFKRYLYTEIALGYTRRTLNEEWVYDRPNHKHYPNYSGQLSLMYRYARRWASGIGVDVDYGDYAWRVEELEKDNGIEYSNYSPWSVGLSLRHETFYKNLSVAVAIGGYLHRHIGANADDVDKRYYEKVHIRYHIPALGGTAIGIGVKAHAFRADYAEIQLAVPIRLTN